MLRIRESEQGRARRATCVKDEQSECVTRWRLHGFDSALPPASARVPCVRTPCRWRLAAWPSASFSSPFYFHLAVLPVLPVPAAWVLAWRSAYERRGRDDSGGEGGWLRLSGPRGRLGRSNGMAGGDCLDLPSFVTLRRLVRSLPLVWPSQATDRGALEYESAVDDGGMQRMSGALGRLHERRASERANRGSG